MQLNPKYKTYLITFILLLGSLSIFTITPVNVKAEESSGETLYFTKYNVSIEPGESPEMSLFPPEGKNYSSFPPSLKNPEEWLEWFALWIASRTLDLEEYLGMNETEIQELLDELGMTLDELLEYFDLFNPFEMKEIYIYQGEKKHVSGNVIFDLYFSSNLPSELMYKDEVKVAFYINGVQQGNDTIATINSKLFQGKIQEQIILLENVEFDLEDEDELLFSIEMLPGNKPIGSLIGTTDIETIIGTVDLIADVLINQSIIPTLKDLGEALKEIINLSQEEGFIFTTEDLADLANTIRSSSFIYDSATYKSSVTIPTEISEEENIVTYYLGEGGELNEEKPTKEGTSKADLKQLKKWTSPGLTRSKILKEATATLYISYRDLIRLLNLGKTKIVASLKYNDTVISTSEVDLKKTTILKRLLRPISQADFTFKFEPIEIDHDNALVFEVSVSNGTKFGLLGLYRSVKLIYDSINYPSNLLLKFDETSNIKSELKTERNQKIVTGGSAEYILNITSKYDDTIIFNYQIRDKEGEWQIDTPDPVDVVSGEPVLAHIFVNHTDETIDAYNRDLIDLSILPTGKTGRSKEDVKIEVSEDAIEYDVEIIAPSGKEIKHGTSDTYTFIITNNNTGLWPDSYVIEAYSEHNWSLELKYDEAKTTDVNVGQEFKVQITLFVPAYTDISNDMLTLKITSIESIDHDKEKIVYINVTTNVILPNILENIYHFYESASETLGLDNILGDYGAWFLIFITIFLLMFFLTIIIYFIRVKYVDIICTERIKEIDPDEKAEFDIKIHNPFRQKLTYELSANINSTSERWDVYLDKTTLDLDSKESEPVKLIVKPTDFVRSGDWVEIKIEVKTVEKQKTSKISTIVILKDIKPKLEIIGVLNLPKYFNKGDLVKTSFRVENRGKVSANNVSVILYLNGEEKNKVEDITIPRGGYADIEMPWIAEKGKNEINIVVK